MLTPEPRRVLLMVARDHLHNAAVRANDARAHLYFAAGHQAQGAGDLAALSHYYAGNCATEALKHASAACKALAYVARRDVRLQRKQLLPG